MSKIDISKIQLSQLNHACLVWVSKFVRALKAHDGTVIRMQDDDAIRQVISVAHHTQNTQLLILYEGFKNELRKYMNSAEFSEETLSRVKESEISQQTQLTSS